MTTSAPTPDEDETAAISVWPQTSERNEHLGAWQVPAKPPVEPAPPTTEDYRKWAVQFAWTALRPADFNPYGGWRPNLDDRVKTLIQATICAKQIADLVVYGSLRSAQPAESNSAPMGDPGTPGTGRTDGSGEMAAAT